MRDKLAVRIPLLEAAAVAAGPLLTSNSRALVPHERTILTAIFQQSVNLDPIRLVASSLGSRATTWGNYIRAPHKLVLSDSDLVHEATHIWQYQTKGTAYISDSALHQAVRDTSLFLNGVTGFVPLAKDPYDVTVVPGQSFSDYGAEEQAKIVENYFKDGKLNVEIDVDVLRMIEEVRKARPLSAHEITQDTWWGPAPPNESSNQRGGTARTVPLIRLEF